jgi:serine/threonine-protein kinase RsbT
MGPGPGDHGAAAPLPPHPVAPSCRVLVRRETDVPQVIAVVRRFCADHGFSALLAAHVATAASELAHNLWLHASHGGELVLRLLPPSPRAGLELLANDDGPGIADLDLALREGWSSTGSLGCGLSGVQRLMDSFEIDSAPGRGTRVRACKWAPLAGPTRPGARAGTGPQR